jgi:tRNA (adenine37-N6)-methyltransferase
MASRCPKGPGAPHHAKGIVDRLPEFESGLTNIDGYSHLCMRWVFDCAAGDDLLVTPPTATRPHAVFARCAPRGPNASGLPVVQWLGREGPHLHVHSPDRLDGSPILDLTP